MKTFYLSCVLIVAAATGCSIFHHAAQAKPGSETVMITYHVQPGKEGEFQDLLARAWDVYRDEHLVVPKPHVVVRDSDGENKFRFVEIFTWLKSPDHAPDSVQAVWKQEQSLCEARDGHKGIEGGEVEIVGGHF